MRTKAASQVVQLVLTCLHFGHSQELPSLNSPTPASAISQDVSTSGFVNETWPIKCSANDPEERSVTIRNCKPTLDLLKTDAFGGPQMYRRVQEFRKNYPPSPRRNPPPIFLDTPEADCVIFITPWVRDAVAHFSWNDVKLLTNDLIEHCADQGLDRGGSALIGEPLPILDMPGYSVIVSPKKIRPLSSFSVIAEPTQVAEIEVS